VLNGDGNSLTPGAIEALSVENEIAATFTRGMIIVITKANIKT
jgi:ABC-type xylose transport system permease subunit